MFCKNCGKELSENQLFCPECGTKVENAPSEQASKTETAENVEKTENAETVNKETEASSVSEISESSDKAEAVESTEASATNSAETVPATSENGTKKTFSKKIIGGAVIAAALVIVISVIANINSIKGGFIKTFGSGEDYLSFVEDRFVNEYISGVVTGYSQICDGLESFDDKKGSTKITLTKDGKNFLYDMGVDEEYISWLNSVSLGYAAGYDDDIASMEMSLKLNDKDIVGIDLIMDLLNEKIYLSSADLSKEAIELTSQVLPYDIRYFMQSLSGKYVNNTTVSIFENLPDAKVFKKLVPKYANIFVSNIGEAESSKGTLEVGEITQKCTAIDIELSDGDLGNGLIAVAEAAKKDKDIKKYIYDLYDEAYGSLEDVDGLKKLNLIPESKEKMYDSFVSSLDELIDLFEDSPFSDNEIANVRIYVNGSHDICGIEIEIDSLEIKILEARKGSKFESSIYYNQNSSDRYYSSSAKEVEISGSGKYSGEKMTGDFTLKLGGKSYLDIEVSGFDKSALSKGYVNGKFVFTPKSRLIGEMTGSSGSVSGIIKALDPSAAIEIKSGKNESNVKISLMRNEDALLTLESQIKNSSVKAKSIPKDTFEVQDEYDFADFIKDSKLDNVLSKLKKAKVPEDAIDAIEDALTDSIY